MLNIVIKPHRSYLRANTPEPQKLFVMLRLIPESKLAQTRSHIAVALVIDTSGSMREETNNVVKLEHAIKAAHRLIDVPQLQPEDKICIIQFDDSSNVLLPLSPLDRARAHQVVETLRNYDGGTQMGKGMQNALQQLGKEPPDVPKRLVLLTDGKTFDEPLCRELADKLAQANIPVLAFGIGDEYNEVLLSEISNATKGKWFHLTDIQQIDQYFMEDLSQIVREVITDCKLRVQAVKGVKIDALHRVYPNVLDIPVDSQPFKLGNIPAGDYTIYILGLTVSGLSRPPSKVRLAELTLWGSIPGMKQKEVEFPPTELFVSFVTDEALTAQVDPEVMDYFQNKNIDNLIQKATQLASQGKTQEARQTLQMAVGLTQRLNNPRLTQILNSAVNELDKTGRISSNVTKMLRAGGRTMTVKSKHTEIYKGD
jgi:Ca-activated chloride channel family protein